MVDKSKTLSLPYRKTGEPKKVCIVLYVFNNHSDKELTFDSVKAERVSRVLHITREKLEDFANKARITNEAETVTPYRSEDITQTILSELKEATPFISGLYHRFEPLAEK